MTNLKTSESFEDILNNAMASKSGTSVEKIAKTQALEDAEQITKIANHLGSVIGQSVLDKVAAGMAEMFGYSPEVTKTASVADIMYAAMEDAMTKVAEQVTGTAGQAILSTQHAEDLQVGETARHHAYMAVAAAHDTIASANSGDDHSAGQQAEAAQSHLEQAVQMASRSQDPSVHAEVAEAHQLVSQALGGQE